MTVDETLDLALCPKCGVKPKVRAISHGHLEYRCPTCINGGTVKPNAWEAALAWNARYAREAAR